MNKTCPFCGKTVKEHEAGRCLDHWIEGIKSNWKSYCLREVRGKAVMFPCIHKHLRCFDAPEYSKDLNAAITLWQEGWQIGKRTGHELWLVEELERFSKLDSEDYPTEKYRKWSQANDPALAICRAYLITNLKEVEA